MNGAHAPFVCVCQSCVYTPTMSNSPAIEDGSIAAQALFHVWSGAPATVVAAPPGAGKTTLLTQTLPRLVSEAGMKVAVAGQTRTQSVDIANRLAAEMPGQVALLAAGRDKIKNSTGTYLKKPRGLSENVHFVSKVDDAFRKEAFVVVATTAKWRYFRTDTAIADFDLLVIDEAWQSTISDVREMGGIAPQYLLVGDPGQISPVVSADVSRFAGSKHAPHLPAPDQIQAHHSEHVVSLQMPATHRCGPDTTRVLQDLYPFTFESARTPQHIVTPNGTPLPEISVTYTDAGSQNDARLFDAVAEAVIEASTSAWVVNGQERTIRAEDIAVGVAHVHQATAVRARLPKELDGVTVETMERLQGLQFAVTVVLDPMAGLHEIADHNADTGRLCVGLSRATSHTRFITTPNVIDVLSADPDHTHATLGVKVRKNIANMLAA